MSGMREEARAPMRSPRRRMRYGLPVLIALFGLVAGVIPAGAAPAAGADDKVPMGGGAGLIINGDTQIGRAHV